MKLPVLLPLALALPPQTPLSAPPSTLSSPPLLGYGTWNLAKDNASAAVAYALETGYRHVDCAAAYGNEKEVGRGIAAGLRGAGVGREEVWVTSKLWNDRHAPDQVAKGLEETLEDLGLEYLDLYLMHWPVTQSPRGNELGYIETWHAMTKLLHTGRVRHIGVSNFSPAQMESLIAHSGVKPFAHQMELHPYLQQTAWVQWHHARGIHVTAYSPLGNMNPTYGDPEKGDVPAMLKNKDVRKIAERRDCTPATLVLAWGMSRGTSVIPKSQHAERIAENYEARKVGLRYEDLKEIEELGRKYLHRFNNPSKSWGVDLYEGLDGV